MLSFDLWLEAEYDITEDEFRKMNKSEKAYYKKEYDTQSKEKSNKKGESYVWS